MCYIEREMGLGSFSELGKERLAKISPLDQGGECGLGVSLGEV